MDERVIDEYAKICEEHGLNEKFKTLQEIIDGSKENGSGGGNSEGEGGKGKRSPYASLPEGVTVQDVVLACNHEVKLRERDRLLAQVASLQRGNDAVRMEIGEGRGKLEEVMGRLEGDRRRVVGTAEVCDGGTE